MAATIITVASAGAPSTNIEIKINDGYSVPDNIITDEVSNFRTWEYGNGQILVWTNEKGQEVSMILPGICIGWVISSRPVNAGGDRFIIDTPCTVFVEVGG